jgi:uncharacterized protein YciI
MEATGSHFIYVLRLTRLEMLRSGPTTGEARTLGEHSNYLKDLTAKGVVILAGRTLNNDESTFGIVVVKAANEAAARAVMENDPFVRDRVASGELLPFHLAFMAGN